jgi:hypothetical protein
MSMFLGPPSQRELSTLPPPPPEATAALITSHALTLPPTPVAPRLQRRRVNVGAIAIASMLASAAALGAAGGAWMRIRRPKPLVLVAPGADADLSPMALAPFATVDPPAPTAVRPPARRSNGSMRGISARAANSNRTAGDETGMSGRAPALPPPRRATASTHRADGNAPTASCGERCNGNIDCLLACRPGQPDAAPHDALVNPVPSRDQISMAMHSIRGAVLVCGMGLPADSERTALVTLVFAPSGHVARSTVGAPYAGTAVGACIARAAQRATVPAFSESQFQLTYPLAVH